jgi:hypothetical protein
MTDHSLVYVGRITSILLVAMHDGLVTDDGIQHISTLPSLRHLGLIYSKNITESGLEHIRRC